MPMKYVMVEDKTQIQASDHKSLLLPSYHYAA